ncbi:hypothetical protein BAG01nite_34460 [Brevibacillus agri]|uniref:Uncharacterized protein n=1 Tax=Brevibacillus agri TaxID=51101 RepID=A0A3M8AG64_9BACL|nr:MULTISPECIES: hypothetical protein [Brevibacillus]EJL38807.1 hypothetical protein PMI08_05328 [Brevibacillus sp. CF112]MCG5254826.1 hypothetical protein [Brevibacillus agri]MDR9507671.1 hypothetical protein [Brevibacillus agri]MED1822635.1 hypothetical protein [Brevibacillus agri]MED3501587.1 hypothetical protein [Brevibacillus agri]
MKKQILGFIPCLALVASLGVPVSFATESNKDIVDISIAEAVETINVDELPSQVEFGRAPSENDGAVSTLSFDTMATAATNYGSVKVDNLIYNYYSEGTTDPDSVLYSVTALTSIFKYEGGKWVEKDAGKKDFRIGQTAKSNADAFDGLAQTYRGVSQHSVAYAGEVFLVYTMDDQL